MSALRATIHALVDSLPEEHLAAAEGLLVSLEDAPVSREEEQGIRTGIAAAARGDLHPAGEVLGRWKARVEAARGSTR